MIRILDLQMSHVIFTTSVGYLIHNDIHNKNESLHHACIIAANYKYNVSGILSCGGYGLYEYFTIHVQKVFLTYLCHDTNNLPQNTEQRNT